MLDYKIISNAFTLTKMIYCIHSQLYIKKEFEILNFILNYYIHFWHIYTLYSENQKTIYCNIMNCVFDVVTSTNQIVLLSNHKLSELNMSVFTAKLLWVMLKEGFPRNDNILCAQFK